MPRGRLSSTDATFAVFDRAADNPFPFCAALVFYVMAALVLFAPAGVLALWDLGQGRWPARSPDVDPLQALVNLAGILMWPVAAMAEAALLRWMLRGAPEGRLLGLRFGLDELKIMLIHILLAAVLIAVIVATGIVAGVGGLLAATFGSPLAAGVVVAVACAVGVLAFLIVLLRFSPAAALMIKRGGFPFFEAWSVSRGNVSALFGAHVLRMSLAMLAQAALAVMLAVVALSVLSSAVGPVFDGAFTGTAPRGAPPLAWAGAGFLFLLGFSLFTALDYARVAMSAGIGARLVETVERKRSGPFW